jgi:hypothetical protein
MWAHRMGPTAALDYVRRGQSSVITSAWRQVHLCRFHSPGASLAKRGLPPAAHPLRTVPIRALPLVRHLRRLAIET